MHDKLSEEKEYQALKLLWQPLADYITEHSGINISDPIKMTSVLDNLYIRVIYQLIINSNFI